MPTFYGPPSDGTVIPAEIEVATAADLADPSTRIGAGLDKAAQNASLVGADLFTYGHSYVQGVGVADPLDKWTSVFQRIYMEAASQANRGVSGHTMEQTLNEAIISSTRKWVPGTRGVILLDSVLNNVLRTDLNNEVSVVPSFRNALTTLLRIFRAGSWVLNTDPTIAYTGTWNDQAYGAARTGTFKASSAIGNKITIADYMPTSIGLMTWGNKMTAGLSGGPGTGAPEARFNVLVNGAQVGPTHDMTGKTVGENDFHTGGFAEPYCTWVDGLPAGAKTIEVEVLATSTGTTKPLFFDGYLRPTDTPPTVIVVKDAPITTYSGAAVGNEGGHALLARLNGVIDDVVAGFNRPGEVVAADAGIGWVPSTMLGGQTGSDVLHPNIAGHASIARSVYRAAREVPYRRGNFSA